jgi:16S rRNA (cytosine967-C5)-methyltransferase
MSNKNGYSQLGARDIALKALETYRRNRIWPDYMLKTYFDKFNISKNDSALAWRIVFGVIQNSLLLEYYILKYSKMPIKKIHPTVMDILKLSAYQIIFLDKIPHSAAVDVGVSLARQYSNPQAIGFVNAILRKIALNTANGSLPKVEAESELKRLSIEFSHSEWLIDEFIEALGIEQTIRLLEVNNSADSTIFAQINTLRASAEEVLAAFIDKGVNAKKHEWLDDCICLYGAGDITKHSAFIKGHIYIQDPASRLAIIASGVKPGDFVVDACSAPGGKAFAAAIMMKNCGVVHAYDKKVSKVNEVKNGALRLGIDIIKTHTKNSLITNETLLEKADVVIADVPCSGFGIIRKRPEIRYKTRKDISGLQEIQAKLLSTVSKYVKPGGILLYSTCSILKQENEDIIESFLNDNSEFGLVGFELPEIGNIQEGMITLLPHIHGTDGFFICKMRRIEN